MRNILVTGGAGFIGSHLIDELVEKSFRVKALDIFERQVHPRGVPDHLNKGCRYIRGDVRDRKVLRGALKGVDTVIHFAAQVGVGQSMYRIHRYTDHNVLGTAQLLDIIVNNRIRLKRLVVASSMSIYGEGAYRCQRCGEVECGARPAAQLARREWEMACPKCGRHAAPVPTKETKAIVPASLYGLTKRDQEEMCLLIGKSYRIPTVALRFFNVYGPRQSLTNPYTGVCAIFSAMIKAGKAPVVYEDGRQTRDFINVRDVVRATILAARANGVEYQSFNVGTGRPSSVLDIARILIRLYGKKMKPAIVKRFRAGDIRHCYADTTRIRGAAFTPSVGFEEGLEELVRWGRERANRAVSDKVDRELSRMGLEI